MEILSVNFLFEILYRRLKPTSISFKKAFFLSALKGTLDYLKMNLVMHV